MVDAKTALVRGKSVHIMCICGGIIVQTRKQSNALLAMLHIAQWHPFYTLLFSRHTPLDTNLLQIETTVNING